MNGVLYYNNLNNPRNGWYSVNLVTGQKLSFTNSTLPSLFSATNLASTYWPALSFGQELNYESSNQHGVFPYLWSTSGSTWQMFDASSGNYICQINNAPTGTRYVDQAGNELIYVLKAPTATTLGWLAQWNSTTCIQTTPLGPFGVVLTIWRPQPNATYDGAKYGYDWNITLAAGSIPSTAKIARVLAGNGWPTSVDPVEIVGTGGLNPAPAASGGTTVGTNDPWSVFAINLQSSNRGTILFNQNYTAPPGNQTLSFGPMDPSTGVWTIYDKETRTWSGYSLNTGKLLWGPTPSQPDLDFLVQGSNALTTIVADGKMYSAGYAGVLFCYDDTTGQVLWNYTATGTATESPYGNYPLNIVAAADGKIYTISSEHTPTNPQWRGSDIRCINATNGQEIWKEECWGQVGTIVTDGYLVTLNAYDDQIYCFGKGPSALTVTAPDVGVSTATPITIRGTVIDKSAGTQQTEQAAISKRRSMRI